MSMETFHITVSETTKKYLPWDKTLITEYDIQAEPKDAYKTIAEEMIKLDPLSYENGLYVRAINESQDVEAFLLIPTEDKFTHVKSYFIKDARGNGFGSEYQDFDEKKRYLVCLDEDTNDYKYYTIYQEKDNDRFGVSYGRIGGTDLLDSSKYDFNKEGTHFYDSKMFWIKYYEKMLKGYEDKTEEMDFQYGRASDLKKTTPVKDIKEITDYTPIENEEIRDLMELLISRQRAYVKDNYNFNFSKTLNTEINSKGIENTEKLLNKMSQLVDDYVSLSDEYSQAVIEKEFRNLYKEVLVSLPRKVANIKEYIDKADFSDISIVSGVLDEERDILQALKDVMDADGDRKTPTASHGNTVLDANGLSAKIPDFADKFTVLDKMGDNAYKVSRIIEVTNEKTQKAYEACKKALGIHNGGCHLLWHGSRTENWWSIFKNGMSLNPDAVITGKMFGQGLYFAPLAQKAMGYVDMSGSYWAHGNQNKGHLALFEVAMGRPYSPDSSLGSNFSYKDLRHGCHSVWAKASKGFLYNDECIVYREDQCNIKYLVEVEYDRDKEYRFDLKEARKIKAKDAFVKGNNTFCAKLEGFYDEVGKKLGISDKPITVEYDSENGTFEFLIKDARRTSGGRPITELNSTEKEYLADVFMSSFAPNKEKFEKFVQESLEKGTGRVVTKEEKLTELFDNANEFLNLGIQEYKGIRYDTFQCLYNTSDLIPALCELYGVDKDEVMANEPATAELYLDIAEDFGDVYAEGNIYDDMERLIRLSDEADLTTDTDKSELIDMVRNIKLLSGKTIEEIVQDDFKEYDSLPKNQPRHNNKPKPVGTGKGDGD